MYNDIAQVFFYIIFIVLMLMFIIPYTRNNIIIKNTYLEDAIKQLNKQNIFNRVFTLSFIIIGYTLLSLCVSLVLSSVWIVLVVIFFFYLFGKILGEF